MASTLLTEDTSTYRVSHTSAAVRGHTGTLLLGKTLTYVKRVKLLRMMCFQSKALQFFTSHEPSRCHTFYIINIKMLPRCYHADMTVKGGVVCVS